MVVRSRSTRVTPTLSVHFTSAIYVVCVVCGVYVWCVCGVCGVCGMCVVCVVCGVCVLYMNYPRGEKIKSLYLVRTGGLVRYLALLCIFLKSHLSSFILYIHPLFLILYIVTRPLHHWCDIVAES